MQQIEEKRNLGYGYIAMRNYRKTENTNTTNTIEHNPHEKKTHRNSKTVPQKIPLSKKHLHQQTPQLIDPFSITITLNMLSSLLCHVPV
jgi:hypothetical protein